MTKTIGHRSHLLLIVPLGAAALLPAVLSPMWLTILIYTFYIAALCLAWRITAEPGMFILCHGIFIAAGAYAVALMWMNWQVNPLLALLPAIAVAVLVALGVGWCVFRFALPQMSIAIFTLVLSYIGVYVVDSTHAIHEGYNVVYKGTNPLNLQFDSPVAFYYVLLATAVLAGAVAWYLSQSALGHAWRAIQDNERVAAASGIDVTRAKMLSLAFSAALTAVLGGVWTQHARYVDPHTVSPHIAITIIMICVIGGLRTVWGPVLGALVLVPLGEQLRISFSHVPGLNMIVYGAVVAIVLLALRKGLVDAAADWWRARQQTESTLVSRVESESRPGILGILPDQLLE